MVAPSAGFFTSFRDIRLRSISAARHSVDRQGADSITALAIARKKVVEDYGENCDREQTRSNDEEDTPDKIVSDLKGDNKRGQPQELAEGGPQSDAACRRSRCSDLDLISMTLRFDPRVGVGGTGPKIPLPKRR